MPLTEWYAVVLNFRADKMPHADNQKLSEGDFLKALKKPEILVAEGVGWGYKEAFTTHFSNFLNFESHN